MMIDLSTVNIPKKPTERRVWVLGQLRLQGTSLRKLAIREGVSPQAMSNALMLPSSHLQAVIAEALGLSPATLFPEFYDRSGNRLGWTRDPQRSTRHACRNVEEEQAA